MSAVKVIYEGAIGGHRFLMTDGDVIEVWGQDIDRPESFIFLDVGSIKDEKDFHMEIMNWISKNTLL